MLRAQAKRGASTETTIEKTRRLVSQWLGSMMLWSALRTEVSTGETTSTSDVSMEIVEPFSKESDVRPTTC